MLNSVIEEFLNVRKILGTNSNSRNLIVCVSSRNFGIVSWRLPQELDLISSLFKSSFRFLKFFHSKLELQLSEKQKKSFCHISNSSDFLILVVWVVESLH